MFRNRILIHCYAIVKNIVFLFLQPWILKVTHGLLDSFGTGYNISPVTIVVVIECLELMSC